MARETLDKKIRLLLDEILILDSMVEAAINGAVDALKNQNLRAAQRIYDGDREINARRFQLENDCMITIATQQPIMGHDLRLLASILEVSAELERMGDYAKGIANICLMIGTEPLVKPLIDIPHMASIALGMLHRAIAAFVNGDTDAALIIPAEDDRVDDLYNQIYRDLISIMLANSSAIDQSNYLIWAAHNLERLADRVTNICERTIYSVTGELKELSASDDETAPQVQT
ncbi:MAG: phosphate signaling complex protein PhoU [Anaerolineales bacterium]|nr:phosphate signaling complex protein PhoU [Anaerolineales bacterium]